MVARLGPTLADLVRIALQTHAVDLSRAGETSDHHRHIVAPPGDIGDVGEKKRLALRFRQAAKLQADQRMELRVFIDLTLDAHEQMRAFKAVNQLANVFVISHCAPLECSHAEGDSRPYHFAGAIGPAPSNCCITDFTFASSGTA